MNQDKHKARIEKREQIARARNEFSKMDDYAKGQIAALGTAFTTYEDGGEAYCFELNRLARDWRALVQKQDELKAAGEELRANFAQCKKL